MATTPKWTILTYIAAHNDLQNQQLGERSLDQILGVGSTHDVTHGILYDTPQGAARYIAGGPCKALKQEQLKNYDSGDPGRLIETAQWVFQQHPAEHYGLILWSHGSGWRPEEIEEVERQVRGDQDVDKDESKGRAATPGSYALFRSTLKTIASQPSRAERAILFDDGTGHSLDTLELEAVTKEIQGVLGQPIDLLGMDACLMATLEVAYQIKDTTRYLVASEELVPGHSWPYDLIYGALRAQPDHSPRDLAERIVHDYVGYYSQHPPAAGDVTKIAVDLSNVEPMAQATKALAEALLTNMGEAKQHLAAAQNATQAIETANNRREDSKFEFHLWDIYSVSNHLAQHCSNVAVKTAADKLCETFRTCGLVVREGHYGAWFDGTGGMSVYLIPPKKGRKRHIASSYSQVTFAKSTHWDAMLNAYQL
jgi:hypothetical protein